MMKRGNLLLGLVATIKGEQSVYGCFFVVSENANLHGDVIWFAVTSVG
jgi:hypothetical protein